MKQVVEKKERNMGVDLLRIVSMFLIVILHLLSHGGLLNNVTWMTSQYISVSLINSIACCSVDCFAIISGYVGYSSKFKWSRVVNLWLQVIFYSLGIALIFYFVYPGTLSVKDIIKFSLPITYTKYWYITAYFGMLFFVPFMNLVIEKTTQKQMKFNLVVMYFALCLFPCLLKLPTFWIHSGYSMVWLGILYLIGGYIKKYDIASYISRKKAIIIFVISNILAFVGKISVELLTNHIFGSPRLGDVFNSYISPLMVINAISLVIIFANLNIKAKPLKKVVSIVSSASLGVYLIHDNPLISNKFIYNKALRFIEYAPLKLVAFILGAAIFVYVVCSLIELVRIWLFKVLKIKKICSKIDDLVAKYNV